MAVLKDYSLQTLAHTLRKNMTPQENKLWFQFFRNYPVKVYRQRIIGHYIVDFYCASAKVVIELDGSQHYSDEGLKSDQNRTIYLERCGLKVLRFTNTQIDHDFDAVFNEIDRLVRTSGPSDRAGAASSPKGERFPG